MSLKGNLNSVDLANIFQMLSINQKEGTLNIFDGESRKSIYFSSDGVCMLSRGRPKKDSLGQILLRYDRISDSDLDRALQMQRQSGRLLGIVLIESGLVDREVVEDALRIQIEEEIYNLFIWKDASFEFIEGQPTTELGEMSSLTRLTFNVNSLIMEAARRIDEWEHISSLVPSMQEIYRYSGKNMQLTDDIFRESYCEKVLAVINGRNQVDEIIEQSHVNKFEVCKILALLLEQAAIEPVPVTDLVKSAETAFSQGEHHEAVKFLDRVIELGGDNSETHRAIAEAYAALNEVEKASIHWRHYAEQQIAAGNPDESYRVYRRICDLLPTDLQSSYRLVELYASHREEIDGDDNEVIQRGRSLAETLLELKKNTRAIQTLHRVIALSPDDITLRNLLINIYLANNMSSEAIDEYEAMAEYFTRKRDWEQVIIILRKILVIDRTRDDLNRKLDQIIARKENQRRGLKRLVATVLVVGGLAFLGYAYLDYELDARSTIALAEKKVAEARDNLSEDVGQALRELQLLRLTIDEPDADPAKLIATFHRAEDLESRYRRALNAAMSQLDRVRTEFRFTTARKQAEQRRQELALRLDEYEGSVKEAREGIQEYAVDLVKQGDAHLSNGRGKEALATYRKAWALAMDKTSLKEAEVPKKMETLEADLARIAELTSALAAAEGRRDYAAARETAMVLLDEYFIPDILDEANLPIHVETLPAGARILVNGKPTGSVTPGWVMWNPGREMEVTLELDGFSPSTTTLQGVLIHKKKQEMERLKSTTEIRIDLEKVVFWQGGVEATVHAAPVTLGNTVYLATRNDQILKLDPDEKAEEVIFQAESLSGIAAGPVGDGKRLFAATIDGELVAVSLSDKKELWSKALPGRVYAPLALAGRFLFVGDLTGHITALEADTGTLLWQQQVPGEIRIRPVVAAGKVLVTTTAGHLHAFGLVTGLPVLDVVPGEEATDRPGVPLVDSRSVYIGSSNGILYCYDLDKKKEVWRCEVGAEIRSAPVMKGNTLYVGALDGKLHAIRDGKEIASAKVGVAVSFSPLIHGDRLYVCDDEANLLCVQISGDELTPLWRYDIGSGEEEPLRIRVPMVMVGDRLMVVAEDGRFYAIER